MAALSLVSTSEMVRELYHYLEADVYECLGCYALIEVPYKAVLNAGQDRVTVKRDPENRLVWLELIRLDHAACGQFRDAKMAEEARRYRLRTIQPRGDDGPRSAPN
jgi:hypothetical protein